LNEGARLTNVLDGAVSREGRLNGGKLLLIHINNHKRHDYQSAHVPLFHMRGHTGRMLVVILDNLCALGL